MKLIQLKNKNNETVTPRNINYEKRLEKLEADEHSTEEQLIGIWEAKPLYRKIVTLSNLSLNNTNFTLNVGDNNIIREINGDVLMLSGYRFPINCYWSNAQLVSAIIHPNNHDLLLYVDSQNYINTITVIVKYTKTTD